MSVLDVVKSWIWSADEKEEEAAKAARKALVRKQEEIEATVGAEAVFITAKRDGTSLKAFIRKGRIHEDGKEKVMLLVAPLGQQNMLSYFPIINHFGDEYTYISFQYRGFFESEVPKRPRRVSIRDHAEDLLDVMTALGYDHADVMMAHSMGVQVAFEFVLLYPERADALVLMNGSHGTVFNQAFQPFFKVPLAGSFAEWLVQKLVSNNPSFITRSIRSIVVSNPMRSAMHWLGNNFGNHNWKEEMGETYFNDLMTNYFGGITSNESSALNWLRGFQELHAHSVKHLLHTIEHPTLLLSGRLDYLTPSWVMSDIAKIMPNAVHKPDWFSTHFSIVENPNHIVKETDKFLRIQEFPKRFKRTSSVHFSRLQSTSALVIEN